MSEKKGERKLGERGGGGVVGEGAVIKVHFGDKSEAKIATNKKKKKEKKRENTKLEKSPFHAWQVMVWAKTKTPSFKVTNEAIMVVCGCLWLCV